MTRKRDRERWDVPVAHDDGTSNGHAGGPGAKDDLVLVAHGPLLELLGGAEGLPPGLIRGLLAVEDGLACAGPGGLVVLDTTALGLDGVGGGDDEDDAEGLELGREGAEGRPLAVRPPDGGEGDGETAEETLDGTADGGAVVSGELFLSRELEMVRRMC